MLESTSVVENVTDLIRIEARLLTTHGPETISSSEVRGRVVANRTEAACTGSRVSAF